MSSRLRLVARNGRHTEAVAVRARAAAQRIRARWEVRAALSQAWRHSAHSAGIRVCWDLDNTLVDSGSLLRAGHSLPDAIVRAEPVPNMLSFCAALRSTLPEADHFILTARTRAMRRDTEAWLMRHGLAQIYAALYFVPYVDAKRRVWEQLARNARLVIIDDLSFNHERDELGRHTELIDLAQRVAAVYVGADEIAAIATDPHAIEETVSRVVATSTASAPREGGGGAGTRLPRGGR